MEPWWRSSEHPLRASLFELLPLWHRRLGEGWCKTTRTRRADRSLPPSPPRAIGHRLRIGYHSADFRDHAMGNLIDDVFS